MRSAIRCAMSTYFVSSAPDDQQDRHPQFAETVPVRRLNTLAEHPQLVGELCDGVGLPTLLDARPITGERREHRLCEPAFEERVDAVALDLLREAFVGLATGGALVGVGDAGRRARRARVDAPRRAGRARAAGTVGRPGSSRRSTARPRSSACAVATKSASCRHVGGDARPRGTPVWVPTTTACLGEAVHQHKIVSHGGILA